MQARGIIIRRQHGPLGTRERIARVVAGALFGFFGFVGAVIGMRSYPLEREALGWSKTFGTLQDARVGADGRIAVRYTFVVDGVKHVGSKRAVVDYGGKRFILEGDAERLINEQQTNGGVDVYYDPANPERSCLQIGTSGSIAHVAIGCAVILLAAYLLYSAAAGCNWHRNG